MDEKDREKMDVIYELAKDNNRMLKKLYRAYKWSRNAKIAYWAIIILLAFGAYYYIRPYIEYVSDAFGFGSATSTIEQKIDSIRNLQ